MSFVMSQELVASIEQSEAEYMADRMKAIEERFDNPEGIAVQRFGNALALYSKTMPWGTFNTVKGVTDNEIDLIDEIIDFYRSRGRKAQFEIVPSRVSGTFLKALAKKGFYQSGFHLSMYCYPNAAVLEQTYDSELIIKEIGEEDILTYARIHCLGTGLGKQGIPYVAQNNLVLVHRQGWKLFIAYRNDIPAAAGVMYRNKHAASLTFAATLPEFRGQGLQQALIRRRIREASSYGCELAVSQAAYLSTSHRNMERAGMKLGYIRTSWTALD